MLSYTAILMCQVSSRPIPVTFDPALAFSDELWVHQNVAKFDVDCWLVNSGWTGGIYGVGSRMPIKVTRALVTGALDGSLKKVGFRTDPYFGFAVPQAVNGIDSNLLHPELTWSKRDEFRETAAKLVEMFQENFKKFESMVT